MSATMEVFRALSGLALYEELRWRVRNDEATWKLLGIDKNTQNVWRRRGDVSDDKRDLILKELERRLTEAERDHDSIASSIKRIEERIAGPPSQQQRGQRRPAS